MRCICIECKILFDIKPPYENDSETHGLCDECFPWVMTRVAAIRREHRCKGDRLTNKKRTRRGGEIK